MNIVDEFDRKEPESLTTQQEGRNESIVFHEAPL